MVKSQENVLSFHPLRKCLNAVILKVELKFQTAPFVGYDFSLFMDNAERLFDESKVIMGIQDEA